MKKILVILGVVVMVVAFGGQVRAAARDCDANAIMWCGAYGKTEWAYKVVRGDGHNSAANIQAVYKAYGVGIDEMKVAVDGKVTRDGKVIVNGKTIATGAKSVGRQYMPGSSKENGVWIRPTSVSFKSDLEAFVYTKNGQFQWAVVKACGNVVTATPVTKPVPVTPAQPTPAPTPTPTPMLPETGMELPFAAALGTTSIGYGLRGYLRSKRQLVSALKKR